MTLPEAFALDVPCGDTIPVLERLTHGRAASVAALRALADGLRPCRRLTSFTHLLT